MNSRIVCGEVWHSRLAPREHAFRYPVYFYSFDLAELPTLRSASYLFGYNQRAIVSLWEGDFLERGELPLGEKLMRCLERRFDTRQIRRVELITCARYFLYVFNPVSFFICRDSADKICCVVAQVNNTFRESHVYVLTEPEQGADDTVVRFSAGKAFHVSPFFDMEWRYRFSFAVTAEKVDIRIEMERDGKIAFRSRLSGNAAPFGHVELRSTLFRYPLSAALNFPRILVQAAKLHYGKRLEVVPKPHPQNADTIRVAPPTIMQRLALRLVLRALGKIEHGALEVELPDRSRLRFGGSQGERMVRLRVRDYRTFERILFGSDIGCGEGYVAGDWECEDLPTLFDLITVNEKVFSSAVLNTSLLSWPRLVREHLRQGNSVVQSRENIFAHYDLGNEFFRTFLADSMIYSSAVFRSPAESLEAAHENQIEMLLEKSQLRDGDELLEIGGGWGHLAMSAARRCACRVRSVTISQEQLHFARERALAAGLGDRVSFEWCDYRMLDGEYDKIISVEMLEAVGKNYLGEFFRCCAKLLRSGGRLVLQVITIPDVRYRAYSRRCDWIQKYIFPGGHLPSLEAIGRASKEAPSLAIEHVENIGLHYATTLRHWREQFERNIDRVAALGLNAEFQRKWRYYLSYCEAGFTRGVLDDLQIVFVKK